VAVKAIADRRAKPWDATAVKIVEEQKKKKPTGAWPVGFLVAAPQWAISP
jgi:hypothetical protein